MLAYVARRWPERSTRFVGLPLILLALLLGIAAWHWRGDLRWAAGALIASIISGALPDRVFNLLDHSLKAWRALREAIPRSTPAIKPAAGGIAPQKESIPTSTAAPSVTGSLVSRIEAKIEQVAVDTALQEIGSTGLAPEAQKVFSDIVTASKQPSVVSIITAAADAAQLLHDALAQVASLKAQPVTNLPT